MHLVRQWHTHAGCGDCRRAAHLVGACQTRDDRWQIGRIGVWDGLRTHSTITKELSSWSRRREHYGFAAASLVRSHRSHRTRDRPDPGFLDGFCTDSGTLRSPDVQDAASSAKPTRVLRRCIGRRLSLAFRKKTARRVRSTPGPVENPLLLWKCCQVPLAFSVLGAWHVKRKKITRSEQL
jgi:hypothetical protein